MGWGSETENLRTEVWAQGRRGGLEILRLEFFSFERGLLLLEGEGQVNMPFHDMMINCWTSQMFL